MSTLWCQISRQNPKRLFKFLCIYVCEQEKYLYTTRLLTFKNERRPSRSNKQSDIFNNKCTHEITRIPTNLVPLLREIQ